MRLRLVILFVAILAGMHAGTARAELPEIIKKYVDDTTLLVGRMDASELSSDAIIAFMTELMAAAPADERERLMENIREGLAGVEETLAPLRERGLTTSWFVMGADSFVDGQGPLTIVPTENDEQAQALIDLLQKERESHRKVEGAVLIGARSRLDLAKSIKPVDRPVLAAPIRVGRGAPAFQMAFEPTPFVRMAAQLGARELAGQMPDFPVEVIELIGALESMSFSMALPPRPRLALNADFLDPESAEMARKLLQERVDGMKEGLERAEIEPARAAELTAAMTPEAKGKRVEVELTGEELRTTVGPIMIVSMLRGREGAARVQASSNLRKLAQGIILWSYERGEGALPPDLASVEQVFDPKADGMTWRQVNRNPRYEAEDAFAYVRPAERLDAIKEPDITVIAYEKPPARGIREGVNVAFADGRVEWMAAADFQELAVAQGFEIVHLPR
jgi:prepilin-type processing-associated H-X9-DG protein